MSNKEIEDLKTLIKALDIRLESEEISQEEYQELKKKYEERLTQEIAVVKEKSFLKNISYVSISGSGKVTDSYISISGSGRIEGWKDGTITISGSGKVTDEEIKISGSGTLPGNLQTEILKVSGSFKAEGPLEASVFSSSGSFKVDGPLKIHETYKSSGAGKINGDLLAQNASVISSGAMKIDGDVLCNDGEFFGSFKINGSVNCNETFTSELNDKCTIDGDLICGGNVYIEQKSRKGSLQVNNIISKGEIYLEGVKASIVRGKIVKVGSDCKIESIEETG